jgi:hypothetical protein
LAVSRTESISEALQMGFPNTPSAGHNSQQKNLLLGKAAKTQTDPPPNLCINMLLKLYVSLL